MFSTQSRQNMASGVVTTAIKIITSFVGFPIYLHFLGYEQCGVWLILATVLTFAQLGNLGISPFLPSKFADYALTGKPILAITPKTSAIRDYLKNTDGKAVHLDQNEIASAIIELFSADHIHKTDEKLMSFFHPSNVGTQYKMMLDEVLAGRRG